MSRFISEADVRELLVGLDSLPWEEEVDDLIEPLIETDVKKIIYAEWIDGMKCSNCGQVDLTKPNYCPNCGADTVLVRGDKE